MSACFLYDDAVARGFEPFALTRPNGELRAGALLVRERWEWVLGTGVSGHLTAPHLRDFVEPGAPGAITPAVIPAGTIVANARFCPTLGHAPDAQAWSAEGRIVAARAAVDVPASVFADGHASLDVLVTDPESTAEISGWWLDHAWDLTRHLVPMLLADVPAVAAAAVTTPTTATVLGDHPVFVETGATIEPFVILDATAGPILVRAGATISAFTRLCGPTVIGPGTTVLGGRVAAVSAGPQCRIHGEVSHTIFLGYANKGHDGFVGHSVLGRWSNLGASTVTSNLKNTYGPVNMWTLDGEQTTGMTFMGSLIGDHAKTAIGTRLMTGTVVGAAANVVSGGHPERVIAPFAFGDGVYRLDKFLEVAAKVMARRQMTFGAAEARHFTRVYEARWSVPE